LNFPAVIREIDRISIVRAMSSALDALRGSSVCPLRSNTGHNQRAAAERRFVRWVQPIDATPSNLA